MIASAVSGARISMGIAEALVFFKFVLSSYGVTVRTLCRRGNFKGAAALIFTPKVHSPIVRVQREYG